MFIGFVTTLVLVIFAFRVLLTLVAIPLSLLVAVAEGDREAHDHVRYLALAGRFRESLSGMMSIPAEGGC